MQPYFIPYTGYFRLFAAADLFVVYDCVQFPRRGWVHRNRLYDASGRERWLTLPIEKTSRDVPIQSLRFVSGAEEMFVDRLRPFALEPQHSSTTSEIIATLKDVSGTPVDYIVRLLYLICHYCGLSCNIIRSSALAIPASFHGQARIIEIARRMEAARYVNSPGGRSLYDAELFDKAGIELRFFEDYEGPTISILSRMMCENRGSLARDVARYNLLP